LDKKEWHDFCDNLFLLDAKGKALVLVNVVFNFGDPDSSLTQKSQENVVRSRGIQDFRWMLRSKKPRHARIEVVDAIISDVAGSGLFERSKTNPNSLLEIAHKAGRSAPAESTQD
jgi:hypothetical protein